MFGLCYSKKEEQLGKGIQASEKERKWDYFLWTFQEVAHRGMTINDVSVDVSDHLVIDVNNLNVYR